MNEDLIHLYVAILKRKARVKRIIDWWDNTYTVICLQPNGAIYDNGEDLLYETNHLLQPQYSDPTLTPSRRKAHSEYLIKPKFP